MRDDFEQELGEYGTFLVYDPLDAPTYDSESVLVLDDILITNGRVTDFPTDVVDHAMMGRFGNIFLVNGQTNYTLTMNA